MIPAEYSIPRAVRRIHGDYPRTYHPLQARDDEYYEIRRQLRQEERGRSSAAMRERRTAQAIGRSTRGTGNDYEQTRRLKSLELDYHRQLNADEAMHRQNQTILEHEQALELDKLEFGERAKRDEVLAQHTRLRDERLQKLQLEQATGIADHTAEIAKLQEEQKREWELEDEKREAENAERLRKIERGEAVEAWSDEMLFDQAEQAQLDIRDRKRYLPKEQKDALAKLDTKLASLPNDPEVSEEEKPFVRADILRAKARIYANAPVVPIEQQEVSNQEQFAQTTVPLNEEGTLFFDLEKRALIDFREEGNEVDASGRKQKDVEYEDKKKAEAYADLSALRKEEREYALKLKALTQYDEKSGKDIPLYTDEEIDAKVRKEFAEQRAALGVELEDPNAISPVTPTWNQNPTLTGGNLTTAAGGAATPGLPPLPPDAAGGPPASSSPSDSPTGTYQGPGTLTPAAQADLDMLFGSPEVPKAKPNTWQSASNYLIQAAQNLKQTEEFLKTEKAKQLPADVRGKLLREAKAEVEKATAQEVHERDEVWAEIWLNWAEKNLTEKQLKNSPEYLQVQKIVEGK